MFLVVNALVGPPQKNVFEHSPTVNPYWQRAIKQTKPKVILLGNSMLDNGVDPALLSQLTQSRTLKIHSGGSASATWYLWLKNIVATASHKPQCVVIFFRDYYLTQPRFRVTGKYKKVIDAVATQKEPTLDRLAYLNGMDPLSYFLYRYCPLFQKKQELKTRAETAMKETMAQQFLGLEPSEADKAIKHVFRNRNMTPSLLTTRQLEVESTQKSSHYNFETKIKKSFLPHMIEIAKKNNIKLMFVRVKRRRDAEHKVEPAGLINYTKKLKNYLKDKGLPLLDYTHDDRITLDYFADGDHLSKTKGKKLFTQLLAEKMIPLLTSQ